MLVTLVAGILFLPFVARSLVTVVAAGVSLGDLPVACEFVVVLVTVQKIVGLLLAQVLAASGVGPGHHAAMMVVAAVALLLVSVLGTAVFLVGVGVVVGDLKLHS